MIASLLFVSALAWPVSPQQERIGLPGASPPASVSRTVGACKISVEYHSPGVKGRSIFGGMVPWGEVWRTGANQPTTIEFGEPVSFGGKEVAAGKYMLATIPGKDSWTVILNRKHEQWGVYAYSEKDDAARVAVKPAVIEPMEWLEIRLSPRTRTAVDLELLWERTRVSVPITVDVDTEAEKKIAAALDKSPASSAILFEAADYYLQSGRNLEKARDLFDKVAADEKNPYRSIAIWRRAQAEWKLGKKDAALKSFDAAIAAAKATEGFGGVVREIEAMRASFATAKP
jgi:hypothetical protein